MLLVCNFFDGHGRDGAFNILVFENSKLGFKLYFTNFVSGGCTILLDASCVTWLLSSGVVNDVILCLSVGTRKVCIIEEKHPRRHCCRTTGGIFKPSS